MSNETRKTRARKALLFWAASNGWELTTNDDQLIWDRLVFTRRDQQIEVYQTQGAGVIREATLFVGGYFERILVTPRYSNRLATVLDWLGYSYEWIAGATKLSVVS